jgi:hypothetical protein
MMRQAKNKCSKHFSTILKVKKTSISLKMDLALEKKKASFKCHNLKMKSVLSSEFQEDKSKIQ